MTPTSAKFTRHHARPAVRWAPLGLAAVLLAGCGGGDGDGGTTPPPTAGAFTVGGSVVGLGAGKALTLQNNGGDDLAVNANGGFVFAARLDRGVAYAVAVRTQPGGQRCAVAQGTGTATANVGDVQVRCENLAAATFTVGGSVSGLAGGAVVLQNNGGDDLSLASNGGFAFSTAVATGSPYAVTVKTPPAGQNCAVRNGSGTVGSAHVGSVEVACATAVALPQGDWKQERCTPIGPGQWGRSLWRIARQGETRATVSLGVATYSDGNCTAAGAVIGGQGGDGGNFTFDRTGATPTLAAFWGSWAQVTGLTSRTVWARKGPYLCPLGDQNPSLFGSAAAVEASADISIQNKACYTQN